MLVAKKEIAVDNFDEAFSDFQKNLLPNSTVKIKKSQNENQIN